MNTMIKMVKIKHKIKCVRRWISRPLPIPNGHGPDPCPRRPKLIEFTFRVRNRVSRRGGGPSFSEVVALRAVSAYLGPALDLRRPPRPSPLLPPDLIGGRPHAPSPPALLGSPTRSSPTPSSRSRTRHPVLLLAVPPIRRLLDHSSVDRLRHP